jgi:MMP 1-O-methyltransferase
LYYGVSEDSLDPADQPDPPEIEGWLSAAQGRALRDAAAASTGRGAIVEIGSWKGRSTAWLATGAKQAGRRVYAVDPHRNSREDPSANTLEEFLVNLKRAKLLEVVEPLIMTSEEAMASIPGPVEILFVDGDHSPAAARRDADLWLPRLLPHGIVMFHDVATAGYSGPRRIFRQRICWSREFDSIAFVGSMGVARRTERRGVAAALWGTASGVLLYLYDLNALVKRGLRLARLR